MEVAMASTRLKSMRQVLRQAREERSPRRALGNMVAAMRIADRIRFAHQGFDEEEKTEAYFASEYIVEHLVSWSIRAGIKKAEINEILDSCLRNVEEEKPPQKRLITPASDLDELFADVHDTHVTVRTLNAMYRFCEELEKDRKKGESEKRSWFKGYPAPKTVGDLTKWTRFRLLGIKDMGEKSVDHLEAVLNDFGYKLKEGKG